MTVVQDIAKSISFLSNMGIMVVGAECGFRDRIVKDLSDELKTLGTPTTCRFQSDANVGEAAKAMENGRAYIVLINSADSADPEMLHEHVGRFRKCGTENLVGLFIDPPIEEAMAGDLEISVREFLHANPPEASELGWDYNFSIHAAGD